MTLVYTAWNSLCFPKLLSRIKFFYNQKWRFLMAIKVNITSKIILWNSNSKVYLLTVLWYHRFSVHIFKLHVLNKRTTCAKKKMYILPFISINNTNSQLYYYALTFNGEQHKLDYKGDAGLSVNFLNFGIIIMTWEDKIIHSSEFW